ncbi:tRNA U-34 5-methylaminomethyl-2-thiouridine biosynthesis protein MnmC, C-terminal domain [Methylophilaceae bacterium 11]|nr:tRNA U-34 5-methylaminomethyl-2-thiouridine biosynthesis protein MnmC, C-terminal domain [Methylophilaceae bacterium 11]
MQTPPYQPPPPAQANAVDWRDGQPYSTRFDDVYFSTDPDHPQQGIAETHYVFLQHNQLENRWRHLQQPTFTIAETGFGTGLNFLCACKLWLETAPSHARLHFLSIEKYPLTRQDMQLAHQNWPDFQTLSQALLAQYDGLCAGVHRLALFSGRVLLTLAIGDMASQLPQLNASVDAWFLDGFSPAKNPDMWQPVLYQQMARLSHRQTTFATFTSAGFVKRGLAERGFITHKAAGFGRKREMLYGQFSGQGAALLSLHLNQTVAVIGAGIAGCATAYALAQRGIHVTLIERHSQIAQEASGNPKGVLYPRLAGHPNAQDRFALSSYLYTLRLLKQLDLAEENFQACGLLQLAFNAKESARIAEIAQRTLNEDIVRFVESAQASELAGVPLAHAGLYFSEGGWVNPTALCAALIQHPNITLCTDTSALELSQIDDKWHIINAQQAVITADKVVIANANDALRFTQTAHLPLTAVRGQMTTVQASANSLALNTVLCTDGYITPASAGQHCLGATFSVGDTTLDLRAEDNQHNLAMVKKMSPQLASLQHQAHAGRAALRCATPDYLPMVGALVDAQLLSQQPPKHKTNASALPWHAGLYLHVGHGTKGLTTAPLCAELLACMMTGEPYPVEAELALQLNPNRFLLRDLGLKRLVNLTV